MADESSELTPPITAPAIKGATSNAPTRRGLMIGLTAGGIAAIGAAAPAKAAAECQPDQENDGTLDCQPFYGARQAGIVTPQPAAALIASFDVIAGDRA